MTKKASWMFIVMAACGGTAAPPSSTTPMNAEAAVVDGTLVLTYAEFDKQLADGRLRHVTLPLSGSRKEVSLLDESPPPEREGFVIATDCVPGGTTFSFYVDHREHVFIRYQPGAPLGWQDADGRARATPSTRCFRGAYALGPGQTFIGRLDIK